MSCVKNTCDLDCIYIVFITRSGICLSIVFSDYMLQVRKWEMMSCWPIQCLRIIISRRDVAWWRVHGSRYAGLVSCTSHMDIIFASVFVRSPRTLLTRMSTHSHVLESILVFFFFFFNIFTSMKNIFHF